ncbi:MAG: histidine phosphatase family protein [Saprospiraceae bacterium]
MTRADELARIMGSLSLDAVYSTNFNRTMQTANPVATDQGLTINLTAAPT